MADLSSAKLWDVAVDLTLLLASMLSAGRKTRPTSPERGDAWRKQYDTTSDLLRVRSDLRRRGVPMDDPGPQNTTRGWP